MNRHFENHLVTTKYMHKDALVVTCNRNSLKLSLVINYGNLEKIDVIFIQSCFYFPINGLMSLYD